MAGGYYHTGDVASRDGDGYITYIGRTDDVFKASDYKVSPFELESVLIEHPAVAEAAVVPAPDPIRLAVPKAYVALAAGWEPDRDTALALLRHAREHLPPYLRVRRIEFFELPKTISGKIRRVELREREARHETAAGVARGGFPRAARAAILTVVRSRARMTGRPSCPDPGGRPSRRPTAPSDRRTPDPPDDTVRRTARTVPTTACREAGRPRPASRRSRTRQAGLSAWVRVSQATNRLLVPAGRCCSVSRWVLVIAMPIRLCRAL